ncbi:hypothetical protein [Salinibaculum rarum]|nr:hypothetical protein [Salinibaculum sp. KK48]
MTEETDDYEFIEEYECESCGVTFIGAPNRRKNLCEECVTDDTADED